MTNIHPQKQIKKNAEKKARSSFFVHRLLKGFSNYCGDAELGLSKVSKMYVNAWYCRNTILLSRGKAITKLCKTRACGYCNSVRMAHLINAYDPQLKPLMDAGRLFFVTVTLPTVHHTMLPQRLKKFRKWMKSWRESKAYKRLLKEDISGLRKLEMHTATFSDLERIHAHFHFLIETEEAAEALVSHWLGYFPEARGHCQDIRQADKGSLTELFKYVTKPITLKGGGDKALISYNAIMEGSRNMRMIQPFGRLRMAKEMPAEEITETNIEFPDDKMYHWVVRRGNWIDKDGNPIVKVNHSKKLLRQLAYQADHPPKLSRKEDIAMAQQFEAITDAFFLKEMKKRSFDEMIEMYNKHIPEKREIFA